SPRAAEIVPQLAAASDDEQIDPFEPPPGTYQEAKFRDRRRHGRGGPPGRTRQGAERGDFLKPTLKSVGEARARNRPGAGRLARAPACTAARPHDGEGPDLVSLGGVRGIQGEGADLGAWATQTHILEDDR